MIVDMSETTNVFVPLKIAQQKKIEKNGAKQLDLNFFS